MTVYPIKATFARGELSPRLHGRVDIEHYSMGLEECTNFYVLRQGGIRRRSGTVFVGEVKDSTKKTRLLPFIFNETQAYVVEFGNAYCRFFALDGQVESGGSPYEVSHSYLEADLFRVHIAQSADVLYLAHGNYFPQKLVRTTETNWSVSDHVTEDGPYLDEVSDGTTLTLSGTGAAHPIMTSNTAPAGFTVASSNSSTTAWHAFDDDPETSIDLALPAACWLEITLDSAKAVDGYTLKADRTYPDRHPITWAIQGYDGSNWITLQHVENETGWNRGETRHFTFENARTFSKYRIYVHATGDNSNAILSSFILHWRQADQTGITLTASATAGINSGNGFETTDVNRPIRLYGSDGLWRWGRITARNSSTEVNVTIGDVAFFDLDPITRWRMSAWNDYEGYPATVGFFEERLSWAGSDSFPRTIWFSESQNYDGHSVSDPVVDSDGVTISMTGGQINRVQWLSDIYDLAAGTTQTVRTIGSATTADAFSASNVQQRQQTTEGASYIQPVIVGETTIYADYHRKRLREFTYSFELNGYVAPELSILSDHIFQKGVAGMAWQAVPDNLLWVFLDTGRLPSVTFEKNQSIVGVAQHFIAGGAADTDGEAVVESAVVVPTSTGDRLWMVVKRTINGATKRTVEYLADPFEEDSVEDGVFLDGSITVTGSDFTTVSGLDHLEGETVGVLADGIDIGDTTVASGQITLPHGVSADKATVGLRYESRAKTLRMTQAGGQDGTALGRKVLVRNIKLDVYETGALKAGSLSIQDELFDRAMTEKFDSPKELHTGFKEVQAEDNWSNAGQMWMKTDRAYPATVRAVVAGVEGEP